MRTVHFLIGAAALLLVIPAANYLTTHYGMVPVGFGLTATAGTYLAGLVFVLRDELHRAHGPVPTLGVILAAALLSYVVAAPAIATASAVAFLVSELADWLVFSRLIRAGHTLAAFGVSNVVGVLVDTFVFLPLAGFPVTTAVVAGQIVGKLWATLPGVLVAARRTQ